MGAFVFYKAEKNQGWTYFESLYFSYTTLLTIGYGDFEPMSNSGKPFFVFWSLLAIPTLTILISNMGDTVVQWVKDATIWLGEVTVLPSNDASVWDRFKYGVYKSMFGYKAAHQLRDQKREEAQKRKRQSAEDDEESVYLEEPPGRILGRIRRRRRHVDKTNERLAEDFEKSEAAEEQEAKSHGDKGAEDEHHYRRILLSEIRKVYADSAASQPKHYTYAEWTHYIELLGQDESDSRYHRQPHEADDAPGSHSEHHKRHSCENENCQSGLQEGASPEQNCIEQPTMRWSWIGQRSPLMGDKDEPEWLLEKLFMKLEQCLQKKPQPTEQCAPCKEEAPTLQGSTPQSTSSGPSVSRAQSRGGAETGADTKG